MLTVGYLGAYPSAMNLLVTLSMLPFMMWRIRLEEDLLEADSEYRDYRRMVPFRLLPGVF